MRSRTSRLRVAWLRKVARRQMEREGPVASRSGRAGGALAIALAAALLVTVVAIRLLDRPTHIFYYRVVDDRTLAIGVISGPGTWIRVTALTDGPETVTLTVSALTAPLPGYGDDAIELTVELDEPIGARSVIDASTGQVVPRTTCLPPAYLELGCT